MAQKYKYFQKTANNKFQIYFMKEKVSPKTKLGAPINVGTNDSTIGVVLMLDAVMD